MTLFGIDISKWQAGMDMARVKGEGFSFVEARASIGRTADSTFRGFNAAAAKAGLPMIGYHFLLPHGVVSIAEQAAACAASIGDRGCPVMVDHEPNGSGATTPPIADAVNFAAAMRGHGYRVPLWYLPHWVWQGKLGSPRLPSSVGKLVASAYVNGSGYASALYPGVGHWPAAYGGLTPMIWQFTDKATVAGKSVDADAFEGTTTQLRELLAAGGPSKPQPKPVPSTPHYDTRRGNSLVSPNGAWALFVQDDGHAEMRHNGQHDRNL